MFNDGCIQYDRLKKLTQLVGKQRLVLDVSCRKIDEGYCIMTDRWQKFTKEVVTLPLLEELSAYCDEFLVHAVDVEGKNGGIETGLVRMLSDYDGIPVTYAGGVHSWDDIELLKKLGKGKIDMTIGSALDLFGGTLSYERLATLRHRLRCLRGWGCLRLIAVTSSGTWCVFHANPPSQVRRRKAGESARRFLQSCRLSG